jgi:hypothetical protein
MQGISWLAEKLLTSEEDIFSMEFVSFLVRFQELRIYCGLLCVLGGGGGGDGKIFHQ